MLFTRDETNIVYCAFVGHEHLEKLLPLPIPHLRLKNALHCHHSPTIKPCNLMPEPHLPSSHLRLLLIMDQSHRRSASTATANPIRSDSHTIRPRSHADVISDTSPYRNPREEDAASDGSDMTSSEDFELDDIASDDGLEDDEETGLTGTDRQKRRRKKRKNTHLDQRIVPGSDIQREEDRLANKTFWSAILLNALFIALWCV